MRVGAGAGAGVQTCVPSLHAHCTHAAEYTRLSTGDSARVAPVIAGEPLPPLSRQRGPRDREKERLRRRFRALLPLFSAGHVCAEETHARQRARHAVTSMSEALSPCSLSFLLLPHSLAHPCFSTDASSRRTSSRRCIRADGDATAAAGAGVRQQRRRGR